MLDTIPTIYLAYAAIFAGFVGLIWSADKFVLGAASIAENFGVAPLIVGLTIVSFGTSAPEVVVSISASLKQAGDLAVGNAIGSNIANVALVLGATMLIAKIPVQHHILKDEFPVLIGVSVLGGIFLYDAKIVQWEGAVLLLLIIPVIWYLIRCKKSDMSDQELAEEAEFEAVKNTSAIVWFVIGLAALIISSEVLVWGAKTTATHFGVSPLIIGLTVIAIGTSLPELAASITSALKGHHDIALGNIIGSNIFNLLAVMSLPGIIHPPTLNPEIFVRDFSVMFGTTLLLATMTFFALRKVPSGQSANLGLSTGVILLTSYVAYYVYLFVAN